MLGMHYIVLSQTIEPSNGMVCAVGFIGVFHDLQKALDAGNHELKEMNVPDYYYLVRGRESSGVVTTDQNGKYAEEIDDTVFGIKIDVIKAKCNHLYTSEEQVV